MSDKPIYILGISCFYHDSAACLLKDGEIVAAAHEERFTRKKHDESIPRNAIEYCLAEAGISIDDVDHVGFYEKPFIKFERLLEGYMDTFPRSYQAFVASMRVWLNPARYSLRSRGSALMGIISSMKRPATARSRLSCPTKSWSSCGQPCMAASRCSRCTIRWVRSSTWQCSGARPFRNWSGLASPGVMARQPPRR